MTTPTESYAYCSYCNMIRLILTNEALDGSVTAFCRACGKPLSSTTALKARSPKRLLVKQTEAEGEAREPMSLEEAKVAIDDALDYAAYRTGLDPNGGPRRRARLYAALAVRLAAEYARGHAEGKEQAERQHVEQRLAWKELAG